jgi:methionyl-tRNA formyltransferase
MNIVFFGTGKIAATILVNLLERKEDNIYIYTNISSSITRKKNIDQNPVKTLCIKYNLLFEEIDNFLDNNITNKIKDCNPQLLICISFGKMIPQYILEIPYYGCWNIHTSLLPRWKGAAPIQRAIEYGDQTTGITIIKMNNQLDGGNILYSSMSKIDKNDTTLTLSIKLSKLAIIGLIFLLKKNLHFIKETNQNVIQNSSLYANKIYKNDGKINWNDYAINIERKIRAFIPWPICFFIHKNLYIRIWKASIIFHKTITNTYKYAMISDIRKEYIEIMLQDGVIRLLLLQLPGSKILNIKDLLNGHNTLFKLNDRII